MIRDHIDNFELPDEVLTRYSNEANSLQHLIVGLDYLCRQITRVEETVYKRIDPTERVFCAGNDPLFSDLPMSLIVCTYHWYAVSACNFVRLLGWIRCQHDKSSPSPDDYVEGVLPEVLTWRNKIAAHFAQTFPAKDKRDNIAEREASVISWIGWDDDAFYASPMGVHLTRGGVSKNSSALRRWSLTKAHKQLRARYWPDDGSRQSNDSQAV